MTNPTNNRDSFDEFIAELNGEQEPAFGDPSGVVEQRDELSTDLSFWTIIAEEKAKSGENLDDKLEALKVFFGTEVKRKAAVGNHRREDLLDYNNPHNLGNFVYNKGENSYINRITKEEIGERGFNNAHKRFVPEGENATAGNYALNTLQIPVVSTTLFQPSDKSDIISYLGRDYFNVYSEDNFPEIPHDWEQSPIWRQFEKHIHAMVKEGGHELIQWFAYNVQNPGKRIKWAPLIYGGQGIGKSVIGGMLRACYGDQYVKMISTEEVNEKYTDWAMGSCVGVFEEIKAVGHNRYEMENKLKTYITEANVSVRPLGKAARNIPNATNYLAFTNYNDALALSHDDRRWFVMEGQKLVSGREEIFAYFAPFWDCIRDNPGILRGWLMSVDVSDFNAVIPPDSTDAKNIMIGNSRNDLEQRMDDLLEHHENHDGFNTDVVLGSLFTKALKEENRINPAPVQMAKAWKTLGYVKLTKKAKVRSMTTTVYVKAHLAEEYTSIKVLSPVLERMFPEQTGFMRV